MLYFRLSTKGWVAVDISPVFDDFHEYRGGAHYLGLNIQALNDDTLSHSPFLIMNIDHLNNKSRDRANIAVKFNSGYLAQMYLCGESQIRRNLVMHNKGYE